MPKLKQTLIKTLVSHYSHKNNQKVFTQKVLQSMSVRTLNNFNKDELGDLLNNAYHFFTQHLNKTEAHFRVFNSYKNNKKQITAIEITSPDANQLLLTIECLIDSLNLRMTRKLHPVFEVSKAGSLLLDKETTSKPYTYIYIAFSSTLDKKIVQLLKEKLNFHLKAITCVEKDRLPILEALDKDIKNLAKNNNKTASFQEWRELLIWLRATNFSFFGFKNQDQELGICSKTFEKIDTNAKPILQKTYKQKSAISFTQIPYKSPVYRFENLMCLKFYDPKSKTDLYCFGLLRRSSLNTNNLETPIIRKKIDYIFNALDVKVHSYNYSEIVRIFVQTPKFELFRSSKESLLEIVENILSVTNPNHIQCFFKKNHFPKTHFLMVVMPPFLFTRRNTKLLLEEFCATFPIKNLEHIAIPGVDLCRLHLYFESTKKSFNFEEESFERTLGEQLKSMEDKLNDFIEENLSSKDANYIKKEYVPFIPYHYQVRTHPKDLLDDLIAIDQLNSKKHVAFRCMPFNFPTFSDLAGRASLLKIYSLQKMDLIHIIPVLENLGLYVIDQLTARVGAKTQTKGFVQSFRIQSKAGKKIEDPHTKRNIESLLDEVYSNRFENDPLNALVLSGLSHHQIAMFLMYRNYFLQCDPSYSAQHINYALCEYPECTNILLNFFETRFNPKLKLSQKERNNRLEQLEATFIKALQAVSFIQHDFSFRQFLLMMKATLRCNYYQEDKLALVIKVNPKAIPICPKPKPYREMFVYNHTLEGVHLRFGAIARGGLRFSDRNFDFRREVLLLAQTQRAKNVVIVPNGAKGGFIIKQSTKPDNETIAQKYQDFISTLLSITDNQLPNGKRERPKDCVLHDAFDPYLVVAADKGTATFSDLANLIAQKRGFWLDDAFASGGSQGYDHKKYGITAKGAWECLRLHSEEHGFKKNDILSCIGIGDMSGDVFGNGLIESKTLKLHAAFNHIHIFIDPNPDPETSWKERNRLFKKERSTWLDYKGLSKGGGVFDRGAKSIKLSKEIKTLLGIDATNLSGPDLIKAILALQVDFIWFGGIGTYIKSESESHLEIGDQNNDSVRVDTKDIKAAIIAEGANSGISMPARIQLSNQGVRLNTDAIDNSAGVSMSDYEVNLKIFAKRLIETKKLKSQKERDALLFRIDKEVTQLVLNTNQKQHRLISLEQLRSKQDGRNLLAFIKQLVSEDLLNLKEEQLPSINNLESFVDRHQAFPRPLLAVLQSYIKQLAYDELQQSPIVDKPLFVERFTEYFPSYIQKNYAKELLEHPLKKAITALEMVNETINYTGISFLYSMQQLMHKSYSEIIEMYLFVSDLTQINTLRQSILNSRVSSEAKYNALLELNGTLEKITRVFLSDHFYTFIKTQHLNDYKTLFKNLQKEANHYFCVSPTAYRELGFDATLAKSLSQYHLSLHLPDVLFLTYKQKIPIAFISDLIFEAAPVLGLDWLEEQLDMQQSTVFWDHMQKQKLAKQITKLKITLLAWVYSLDKKQALTTFSFDQRLQLCHASVIKKAQDYFNHLGKLKQQPEDINLTSLNVCIQQLDELCYAIKHH